MTLTLAGLLSSTKQDDGSFVCLASSLSTAVTVNPTTTHTSSYFLVLAFRETHICLIVSVSLIKEKLFHFDSLNLKSVLFALIFMGFYFHTVLLLTIRRVESCTSVTSTAVED